MLGARRNSTQGTQRHANLQEVTEVHATQEHMAEQQAPDASGATAPPTQRAANTPTVSQGGGNKMSDMNAGILDNIDGVDIGGNYVTMDGSDFLFKATSETAKEIDIVVGYGKRFYQWYDEDNNQYHNSDTKLDDRYKMKFEIRWTEEVDGEPTEFIMTLPTASALNFITYVKGLANQGLRINQVVTRMHVERVLSRDGKNRFSRTEFTKLEVLN